MTELTEDTADLAPMTTLTLTLLPFVRAANNRGHKRRGVQANIGAALMVLQRSGMLSETAEPELILRAEAVAGQTCDWGHCYGEAKALRWSTSAGEYLPVCADCAVDPLEGDE